MIQNPISTSMTCLTKEYDHGRYVLFMIYRVVKSVINTLYLSISVLYKATNKGLLTKVLTISQIWPKLGIQVEKEHTKEFPKFQVHKLCGSQDICIQKCVILGS